MKISLFYFIVRDQRFKTEKRDVLLIEEFCFISRCHLKYQTSKHNEMNN